MKYAFVLYSGGKDSHLALYHALEKGYKVWLFYVNAGKRQPLYLNSPNLSKIIKMQAKIMGLKLYEYKLRKPLDHKEIRNIFYFIISKFKKDKIEDITFFSSNDYMEEKRDKKDNELIREICLNNNIKFVSFKKIIKSETTSKPIKMCERRAIKSILISTEKEISRDFLSKYIDDNFIKHIVELNKRNIKADANDFQSLVVESPLFSGLKLSLLEYGFIENKRERATLLNIKKWKFEK